IVGGFVQTPWGWNAFDDFLEPVFTRYPLAHAAKSPLVANVPAILFIVAVALAGIYLAYSMYGGAERGPHPAPGWLYNLLYNKSYVDEIYDAGIVQPARASASTLYSLVDRSGVDAAVNGVARLVAVVSRAVSPVETGYVRTYALSIFAGIVLVALV